MVPATIRELASKYDYFIFDQDGVVWHGSEPIGEAFRNIEWLESLGKKVYFVTNNSIYSRKSLAIKLASDKIRYKNVKIDHLYPSSTLAGLYVKNNLPDCKKVWVLGTDDFRAELKSLGVESLGGEHGLSEYDATAITAE